MEKENFEPVETLTPLEAGRILGKNQETISEENTLAKYRRLLRVCLSLFSCGLRRL